MFFHTFCLIDFRKMGGEEFSASYREQLEKEIEESFANFRSHNDGKNLFKAANTPITLGAVSMLLYVASQVLSLLGLSPFAQLLNLALTLTFFLLAAWGYVRYTGRAPELGDSIDAAAVAVWEKGLQPAFSKIAEEGTQMAARKAAERLNSTSGTPASSKKNV